MGLSFSSDGGGEQPKGNDSLLSISNNNMDKVTENSTPGYHDPKSSDSNSFTTDIQAQIQKESGYKFDFTPESVSRESIEDSNSSTQTYEGIINVNETALNRNSTSDDFKLELFGTIWFPFKWLTLPTLLSWVGPMSSIAMIVGCVMPFVPQYLTIHKYNNSSGFSTYVCLTLLLSNILRVAFWFGHPFELPLLIQSVVMILTQILLLELCIRVGRHSALKRRFLTSKLKYFWRWTDLISYLEFLCLITALLGIAMYFLIDCELFVETIGYCSLVTESMLGLPQVLKNYKSKSVKGMSLSMVIMWLGGDTFKTGYFIANSVPFQFWLCGIIQISIDLIILTQVCIFR